MTDGPAMFGFVYGDDDPYKAPDALEAALERFQERVGISPSKLTVTSTGGKGAFTAGQKGGSIYMDGGARGGEKMTIRYYLRHQQPRRSSRPGSSPLILPDGLPMVW